MQAVELSAHNRPMVVSQSTVSQEGNETPRHSLEAQALAAMASIARSPDSPGIEDVDADWARLFLERFSPRAFAFSIPGDKTSPTSADPHAQKREVMRIVETFGAQPYEAVERYGVPRALHSATIVPYRYIQRRLVSVAIFRHSPNKATPTIQKAIASLIDEGQMICVGEAELRGLGFQGVAYRRESCGQYKYDAH